MLLTGRTVTWCPLDVELVLTSLFQPPGVGTGPLLPQPRFCCGPEPALALHPRETLPPGTVSVPHHSWVLGPYLWTE